MFRSYSLRLKPTKRQREELTAILALNCDLYNAALQERRDAWAVRRKRITYINQSAELTEIRRDDPGVKRIAVEIARDPLRRVDRAFLAFFRRCKSGDKPGYPRFRAKVRYDSFTYCLDVRIKHTKQLRNDVLLVPNLGGIKYKASRPLSGTPKAVTVKRDGKKWTARVLCDIGPAPEKKAVSTAVGIDVGLTNFVTLSDGTVIANPRWTRQHADRIAKANKSLSRKQRRSKNRIRSRQALARAYQRAADARRNFTHHVSKWLVSHYDLIAYENLKIERMVHGKLAKSILDAAWGELVWQITYKAEEAGKWAVPVNPRGTTINCSACGNPVRKGLSERTHRCPNCGLVLDRDHNAALNILRLGESLAGHGPSEQLLNL